MTVSSSTSKVQYNGDGSTAVFPYTFKVFDQDDLTVIIRSTNGIEITKTVGTHYTVSGVGGVGGGNVTMLTAPASGEQITILREQALVQGLNLVPNDPFPSQSVEDALDRLTFVVQQHEEELNRAIKASRTNTITSSEFTALAAARANKVLGFDDLGELSVSQALGTYLGNWSTSTTYSKRDFVKDTSNNNIYICLVAHTSTGAQPIASNADAAKWELIVDSATATSAASQASASASNAAISETNAQTSAASSATSAGNALASASSASTSATAAAASFDSFDDRYLGAKATEPSTDNDGNPLLTGALYFNSTSGDMRVYTGSVWSIAYLPATGYVTLSGTDTLLNKTLDDPKLSLGGTNGSSGQALVSQGTGLAPVWGSVTSVATKTYSNRADLRSIDGPASLIAVVESLGVFAWESGNTQIDDDETCFATASGRWLLYAAAWDLVYEYIVGELGIINESSIAGSVSNTITSLAANSIFTFNAAIPGATVGDVVSISPPVGFEGRLTIFGQVTASDTVTVTVGNASASTQNFVAGTYNILVSKGLI